MDRFFTVRFWRIEHGRGAGEPLLEILTRVAQLDDAKRLIAVDGRPFWMDKLERHGSSLTGRLCRRQSENLPPKAPPEGGLVPLGIPTIGKTAVFKYDGEHSVLVMEASREGVGHTEFIRYVRALMGIRGYVARPVIEGSELEALRTGRRRELVVQVATPQNLDTITPDQIAVAHGMTSLMVPRLGSRIQIRYSLEVGDKDINPGRAATFVKWFMVERAASRGGISKIQARVVDDEGVSNDLEFIEAQMQDRSELTVPDDDPDKSYDVRHASVVRAFDHKLSEIARQFRK